MIKTKIQDKTIKEVTIAKDEVFIIGSEENNMRGIIVYNLKRDLLPKDGEESFVDWHNRIVHKLKIISQRKITVSNDETLIIKFKKNSNKQISK
jgi:hypothetical protein